jgi:hypothetical protein
VVLLELAFSGRDVDIQKFIIIVLYILIDIDKSVSWAHGREVMKIPFIPHHQKTFKRFPPKGYLIVPRQKSWAFAKTKFSIFLRHATFDHTKIH